MCSINWQETFSMFTVIGTLIMAISVSIASGVAIKTLLKSQDERRHELSTSLLNTWQKDEYHKKFKKINEFYNLKSKDLEQFYEKNKKTPIDFTPFDDEFMDVLASMVSIKNFINKINYYLDKKKLTSENIDFDFNSRLILNKEKSMKDFYEILKWGYKYINFGGLITTRDIEILNNFYLKVSKYKKYSNLFEHIREDNKIK